MQLCQFSERHGTFVSDGVEATARLLEHDPQLVEQVLDLLFDSAFAAQGY